MCRRLRIPLLLSFAFLIPPSFAQEKLNPVEALYGEWEVVEMIFRARVQDFQGKSGGWFIFDKEGLTVDPSGEPNAIRRAFLKRIKGTQNETKHAITARANELDIEFWKPKNRGWTTKAYYELKDDKLRILWGSNENERPTDFDEAYKDPRLTYYVLRKVK